MRDSSLYRRYYQTHRDQFKVKSRRQRSHLPDPYLWKIYEWRKSAILRELYHGHIGLPEYQLRIQQLLNELGL